MDVCCIYFESVFTLSAWNMVNNWMHDFLHCSLLCKFARTLEDVKHTLRVGLHLGENRSKKTKEIARFLLFDHNSFFNFNWFSLSFLIGWNFFTESKYGSFRLHMQVQVAQFNLINRFICALFMKKSILRFFNHLEWIKNMSNTISF